MKPARRSVDIPSPPNGVGTCVIPIEDLTAGGDDNYCPPPLTNVASLTAMQLVESKDGVMEDDVMVDESPTHRAAAAAANNWIAAEDQQSCSDPPSGANATTTKLDEIWAKFMGCAHQLVHDFKAWRTHRKNRNELYSSKLRPTNRLILLVVVMSFIMALTVAGTAVGLQWQSSTDSRKEALRTELNLASNAVSSFVSLKRATESQVTTATVVTNVIREVGYRANLDTMIKTQQKSTKVIGMMMDNLYQQTSVDKANLVTALLTTIATRLCSRNHCDLVSDIFDAINAEHGVDFGLNAILANMSPDAPSVDILTGQNGCRSTGCLTPLQSKAVQAAMTKKTNGTDFDATDYVGFSPIPSSTMGLVFAMSGQALQPNFLNQTVRSLNYVNSIIDGTVEVMIQLTQKPGFPLTTYRFESECKGTCLRDEAGNDVVNGAASSINMDYRHTDPVVATAYPLLFSNGSVFVFEIDYAEVINGIYDELTIAGPKINAELSSLGSQKLLLGRRTYNKTSFSYSYTLLDNQTRMAECGKMCRLDQAMSAAAATCHGGSGTLIDYRGVEVVAAYDCVSDLNLAIALEMDSKTIISDSVEQVVQFANGQNTREATSIELMITQYDSQSTIQFLTTPKEPQSNLQQFQRWSQTFPPAVTALAGGEGLSSSTDYRGTAVLAAYDYSPQLKIGFILKLDVSDFQKPLIQQLLILLGTAIGIALVGVMGVGFFARRMLSSIEITWEKGKKAVQEQKESFEQLVGAMYPKFATEKLLTGEVQIVLQVPESTIFFSDICNFTSLSNRLSASDMLNWIGYLFGVMDTVAEFHKVYKVKTIGDAYFAISGPPSLIDGTELQGHALRMLRFASDCAQIFSGSYTHPDAGACLTMIAQTSALMRREEREHRAKQRKGSAATSQMSGLSGASSLYSSLSESGKQFSCQMRYGISTGAVVMGVLQGKRPMFDVWGKTVNLAARLEHTGNPGFVQCSEATYKLVTAEGQNEFVFDEARMIFAKGFGNVPAYFIKDSINAPPKQLLLSLALEPALGRFNFAKHQYVRQGGGGGGGVSTNTGSASPAQIPGRPTLNKGMSFNSKRKISIGPNEPTWCPGMDSQIISEVMLADPTEVSDFSDKEVGGQK